MCILAENKITFVVRKTRNIIIRTIFLNYFLSVILLHDSKKQYLFFVLLRKTDLQYLLSLKIN